MRGISPSAQDKWLGIDNKVATVRRSIEDDHQVKDDRQERISALEQQLAKEKAEADRLRDLVNNTSYRRAFLPQKVAQIVAHLYGCELSHLRGASRAQREVVARHHAMFVVKQLFPYMSLPQIGRMFGGRDHTTVIHALKAHPKRVERELTRPEPNWGDILREHPDGQE